MKTAFEKYFLMKMRLGAAVPWFDRLALRGVGLSLVEPIAAEPDYNLKQPLP
ncbi:hypothetical protein [Leptothermofonsia sp. ETS-13]|uniref:hypothetical protein n=1 Tax=Leptothermofonsia sp. ETS-13 TaxID=3035696 RepID=UPI003B9F2371